MGSDSIKIFKSGFKCLYKYAGLVVFNGNNRLNRLKFKIKEEKDHGHSQQIKSSNFTVSLGQKKGKDLSNLNCH